MKHLPEPSKGYVPLPWEENELPVPKADVIYPKVSIVTPSFNQGLFIEQTIRSLLLQNYPDLELIIIDGGSTDQTVEIIRKYEKWISFWVSEKDEGQSDALNKGLKKCSGRVFNWLNSDDYLESGALLEVGELYSHNPNASMICGYCNIFEGEKVLYKYQTQVAISLEKTLIDNKYNQPSSFYNLDKLRKVLPVETGLRYCMDLDLWYRFFSIWGIDDFVFSNSVYSYFRCHPDSKSLSETENFMAEIRSLFFSIFMSCNPSQNLVRYFENAPRNTKYKRTWDLGILNPKESLKYSSYWLATYIRGTLKVVEIIAIVNQLHKHGVFRNPAERIKFLLNLLVDKEKKLKLLRGILPLLFFAPSIKSRLYRKYLIFDVHK